MNQKTNKRLERLEKQREIIKNRIHAIKMRNRYSERKRDVRRKILIGAYYYDKAVKENSMGEIKKIMNKFLTRDIDRELFQLDPLSIE